MLDVGIIGVDQEWERYRPVFSKLRRPLRVQAVYDPVRARAERAAERLQASVVTGLQTMARRSDVEAILLFNSDWMGPEALQLLLTQKKPVFVNPWFFTKPETYQALFDQAAETGLPVMPTMWRRFTPATMRLRELIATKLGPPKSIRCEADWSTPRSASRECEELVGWMDYCRTLFRVYPTSVARRPVDAEAFQIVTSFGSSKEARQATLTIHAPENRIDEIVDGVRRWSPLVNTPPLVTGPSDFPAIHVDCEHGSATVESRTSLKWEARPDDSSANSASTESQESHHESLASERPEHEVMLDLFCRRVVGGLIPIADFNDIFQASRLLQQAFGG
jgi:hypothetical protein